MGFLGTSKTGNVQLLYIAFLLRVVQQYEFVTKNRHKYFDSESCRIPAPGANACARTSAHRIANRAAKIRALPTLRDFSRILFAENADVRLIVSKFLLLIFNDTSSGGGGEPVK